MAALSTETGKCSGITEGGTSLRSQNRNTEVVSQLTERLLKGPHKCNAEEMKQTPSVVKTLPKVISKSVYKPSLGSLKRDLKKHVISLSSRTNTSYS